MCYSLWYDAPTMLPRPLVQKKSWRDSLPIDMLLSAVSVLVVAQSSSEIPEGLMNNSVYSERVFVALGTKHTMRMSRIMFSSVACLDSTTFFSHYLTNGTIFGRKKLLKINCVLIFSTNFA